MKKTGFYILLAVLCIMTNTAAKADLVYHYLLEEDLTEEEAGLDGTFVGEGFNYIEGPGESLNPDGGIECDYSTYVTADGADFIGEDNAFSVAFWVKTGAGTDTTYQVNCGLLNLGGFGGALLTELKTNQGTGGLNGFAFGNSGGLWFTTWAFPDDVWYHIVFTYDGTTSKLYVNTLWEEESTVPVIAKATHPLTFGGQGGWSVGDSAGYTVALNDVRMYDTALSAEEVAELADIPEPGSVMVLGALLYGLLRCRK
jgi:hypothetical protein